MADSISVSETNGTAAANGEKHVNGTTEEKSPTKENETKPSEFEEGERAFLKGKRAFLIHDYPAAVADLAKACEIKCNLSGELADDLGDVYFYYGKALIANSRSQSGVFGDQLEKDKENDEQGDEDEDDDEGGEEGGDEEVEGGEVQEENADKETTENKEEGAPDGEEAANGAADETQEASDLQLSWEILEMARVIYERHSDSDKDTAVKLAEVHLALGENGLESESYDNAIADFNTCLDIQRKNLEEDDRRIAETLYQLGIAYSMQEAFDEAIQNFEASIEQLHKRLTKLQNVKDTGSQESNGEKKDAFYTVDGEIEDINGAIKEIKDKITDMEDYKKHVKEESAKALADLGASLNVAGASTSSAALSSTSSDEKPVSNISHLVRKKRKTEDEAEGKEEKKLKSDDTNRQ